MQKIKSENIVLLANRNDLTEDEWLEIRRKSGIGGSEMAAILGVNPYQSPLSVYYDKVEGSDFEGNIHTEFGNWMEPHIRDEFPKRFLKTDDIQIQVYEYPYVIQHKKYPFLIGNIDGIMIHPELGTGIIEIKTASERNWQSWEEDKLPDMYYVQVMHYLAITDLSYAYIVALVGKRLLWKHIPRNEDIIKIIARQAKDFWHDHVLAKIPPAPIGLGSDTDTLKKLYPEEDGQVVELHEYQDKRDKYKELMKQKTEVEKEIETIKQQFMAAMGESETAMVGDRKVTWKTVNRKGFTVKPSSSRQLRIY